MVIGRKKKTPSRVKYEQKRPTFSFRTYKELDERIQAVKKTEGISNTNIVEIAIGLLEVKVAKEKEAKRQGYEEGFEKGYEEAESIYKVIYPCKVCRKALEVTTLEEKQAIRGYMLENGWGHIDCVNHR